MPLECSSSAIPSIILVEPKVFEDERGFFLETYHLKKYRSKGIAPVFVQDNHSRSQKGTLRGLHYQLKNPQGKLVYVVTGEIFDVAVDIRRGSPSFGQWCGAILSESNKHQMYLPEGFAHGFCVLSETADVMYKCTDLFDPTDEYGIVWNDPTAAIDWPIDDPVLSSRDSQNPRLADVPVEHLPMFSEDSRS